MPGVKMRFPPLLATLVMSVAVAACTFSDRPARLPAPEPVSATMSVSSPHPSQKLLTYTVSVPSAKLEAGSDMTVTVTVTNSTDATESSSQYYRVTVTNAEGKVWADNHPPGLIGSIGSVLIGPKQTYRHEVSFGVPPAGVYVVQMPDVYAPHDLNHLAVAFESVASAGKVSGAQDETLGPLALGQVAKLGPYEVMVKRVSSIWAPVRQSAQLAVGVVVQNPKESREASLPIPTFETFTLIDGAGRSWKAGSVSLTTTGWHERPPTDLSSGTGEFLHTVLRPGDYFYMSPIFFVPADAEGLMLIYRPLVKSPGKAVEFVIGRAYPETTIGDVVKEMKARARAGDLAYFEAHAANNATGKMMMRAVKSADMSDYQDHLALGDDNAGLDYHDDGNFQVDLAHSDDGWSLRTVLPCW
jgi:hypothetical protein